MMHDPRGRPGVVLLLLALAAAACSSSATETAGVAAAAATTRRLLGNPCGKGSHVCGVRCVPNESAKICKRKCVTSPKTCRQSPEDCIPCPGVRNGKAVCSEAGTCSSSCSSGFELAATSGSKRPGSAVCIKSVFVPPPPPPPSPAPVGPQLSKTFFGLHPNAAATQASKEQQLQQYAQLTAARDSVLSALLGQQPSAGSSSNDGRAALLAAACGGSATTPCDGALDALTMALLPAAYSSSSSADTGTAGGFISPAQNQLTCAADVAFAATAAAEAALATALQQSHTSVVGLSEHDCAFCRMTPKVSCSSGSSYDDFMASLAAGQLRQWASRADAPFLGSVCGRPSAVPATATQLLGCFRDPQLSDGSCGGPQQKPLMLLQVAPGSMTVDACATLARRRGFQYIALANGRDCFGGNSIRPYVVAGTVGRCDLPCDGSAQQVCGSSSSGCAAAVYSVTSGGSFSAAEGGAPLQTMAKIKRSILLNGGVLTSIVPYSDLVTFYSSGAGGVYSTSADNSGALVQLHALFCFGWSDEEQAWQCKNSLGSSWGLPGGTLKVAYGAASIMQGSYSFSISFNPDNQGLTALQRLRRQSVRDPQEAGCFLYGGAGSTPMRLLQLASQLEQAWSYLARSGLATSQPDSQTILEDLLMSAAGAPDAAGRGASSASGLAQALNLLSTSAPLRICGASAGLLEPPSSQLDALLQLKADVDPTNTVLAAWTRAAGGDGGFCSWPGVACDALQHVTGIVLANLSLGGVMPPAGVLHGLPFLSTLDLSNCSLGGALPQPLTGLPLDSIQLQNNNISSGLPAEWSGLSATLRLVDLSGNAITGGLPEDWHSLDSLVTLRLANNRISGPAPSWALCENLREVDLSFNELSGALPARLPCRLETLNLAGNQLSGQLPPVISSLTNLKALNLGSNRFEAQPLPPGDGWSSIESLAFDNNQFTQIPDSYGQLSTLLELLVHANKISALPVSLGSSNKLSTLLAHENKIVGQLPSALNAMAGTLTRVTLYKNRDLRGCLPMDWQGKVNQPGSGYALADLTTGTGIPPEKPFCVPAPPPPPPRRTPPDTVTNPNGGSGSSGGSSSGGGGAVMPGGSSGSGGCDPGAAGGGGGGGGGGDGGGGGGGWGGGDYGR